MRNNEIARPKVILDGQQAEAELEKLTQKANKYREAMFVAASIGDSKKEKEMAQNYKRATSEINSFKREALSVESVLKNINGASINELSQAYRKANLELKKMKQSDPGFAEQKENVGLLKSKLKELSVQSGNNISVFDKLKNTASGLLPAFGFAAIGVMAQQAFSKVIGITDTLGTKWDVFTGGLKSGMDEFWRTIATGDWSNLIDNMGKAISVGREYQKMLDLIEEKSRALKMIEATSTQKELELEDKLRNKRLSKAERIEAGEERIKLEEDLAKQRTKIAQDAFDAELMVTMQQTKLSKDRLLQVVSDIDSESKVKANAYNDEMEHYQSLMQKSEQFNVVASRTGVTTNPYANDLEKSKSVLDSYPDSIKTYAEALKGVGNTTDEQLNRMVESYEQLKTAENSSMENTKRVRTMVNSLFASEDNEEKAKAAEAAKKKLQAMAEAELALSNFMKKTAQEQQYAIEKYFSGAGEGAFDSFVDAFEKGQQGGMDLSNIPDMPEEKEKKDPALDYAMEKFMETPDWLALQHKAGIISEQEYQDKLLEITKKAEDEKTKLAEERIEKVNQVISLGSNFVSSMMDLELAKAGDNEEKKAQIRKKYAKMQFLITASQIIADTASGIMKGFAQTGIFGGPIAAAIIGATGALQLATAYAEMQKVQGLKSGGYTGYASNDDEVVNVVHSNEFVANAKAVRNPTVRPVLDIINIAQKNGSIHYLNLAEVLKATGNYSLPKKSGINSSTADMNSSKELTISVQSDPKLSNALEENTKAIKELMNWSPTINIEEYERKRKRWEKTTTGGLKP